MHNNTYVGIPLIKCLPFHTEKNDEDVGDEFISYAKNMYDFKLPWIPCAVQFSYCERLNYMLRSSHSRSHVNQLSFIAHEQVFQQ